MNKQDKQKCIDTVDSLMVTRGNGGPGDRKKKESNMVMEGDLALGSEHAMQYTDVVF